MDLQANMQQLQGSLQANVHTVLDRLGEKAHSLQEELKLVAEMIDSRLPQPLSKALRHEGWPTPRWAMYTFCVGAMICLLCSGICHLFACCR